MNPGDTAWEEQALQQAVLNGDQRAWRALYDRAFDQIFAYVHCRVNRQPHRAEEVVQETWLVAVRRIGSFDARRGCFESWLKGIANKVLANHRRRWTRDARTAQTDEEFADATRPGGEASESREVLAPFSAPLSALAVPARAAALRGPASRLPTIWLRPLPKRCNRIPT